MDDEVSRVGSEGLRAVAAATEAFLKLLASQALSRATREKRKNFRFDDLLAVAKQDRRMGIMGLSEIFQEDPIFQEVGMIRPAGMMRHTFVIEGKSVVENAFSILRIICHTYFNLLAGTELQERVREDIEERSFYSRH